MAKLFSKIALVVLASFSLYALPAHALVSPIGISLLPMAELPPSDFVVTGARINLIWGQHKSVYGLDAGVVNETKGEMAGVQVGVANFNDGSTTGAGLQFGAIGNFNTNKANIIGVQAGLINSNKAESSVYGLGLAAANITPYTKVVGVQAGIWNQAGSVYGFQIGLINSTQTLHGLQIGLLNFNVHGLFAVAPILNADF
jgi:hypothetical protein